MPLPQAAGKAAGVAVPSCPGRAGDSLAALEPAQCQGLILYPLPRHRSEGSRGWVLLPWHCLSSYIAQAFLAAQEDGFWSHVLSPSSPLPDSSWGEARGFPDTRASKIQCRKRKGGLREGKRSC